LNGKFNLLPKKYFYLLGKTFSRLKTVKITCSSFKTFACLRFNDLKTLSKLDRLDLEFKDFAGEHYLVDVSELATLTDLSICGDARLRFEFPFVPMTRMKKFEVGCYWLDLENLNRIVEAMPGLKVLAIDVSVGKPIHFLSAFRIKFG
jgi:hypothetical protein